MQENYSKTVWDKELEQILQANLDREFAKPVKPNCEGCTYKGVSDVCRSCGVGK